MNNKIYNELIGDNFYVSKSDINGVITYVNNNFCLITQFDKKELLGHNYSKIKSNDNKKIFFKDMWDILLSKKTWKGVIKNVSKDNKEFYSKLVIFPVLDEQKEIVEFISYGIGITNSTYDLQYDKLTNLKSRESLKSAFVSNKNYVSVVTNIDNFSEINEFYGGEYGDMVLKQTAMRFVQSFIDCDIYRLQADEFLIVKALGDIYIKDEQINEIKSKLDYIFDKGYDLDDIKLHITSRSGLNIGTRNHLRNANIALKHAKTTNANYSFFQHEMLKVFANFTKNKKIASDIKEAVKNDNIVPYYQAIVDNKTKKTIKYESLARLIKENDVLSPFIFIDVSKKIKFYHEITKIMLKKSFDNFSNTDIGVSINLTIDDILNINTYKFIIKMLSSRQNNSNITFELVETDRIEDFKIFDKFVKTIRSYGAKISIDDFGTGYSNFSYLAKIEPDYLKIDGSLIKNIENKKDFDVVKTIISFAKMYNIKTIAEFVENEKIFDLVKQLDIDYSQGYYFSKPLAHNELIEQY